MFEHIKKRIIKGLIEEIKCLDAVGLELVGHNVISVFVSQKLIHHGINKNYKPSGYTVDTYSNDSTIVAEYSTEISYFDSRGEKEIPVFEKINNDIDHALSHKPPDGPEKIYLVSNQEEPPSFRSKFNSTEHSISFGSKLIIFDARELAKEIYDQSIKMPSAADFYRNYFPAFSQDLDNYEYFGRLPGLCENHVSDSKVLGAIACHYKKGSNICILHGVSGSGKTQAAIDFVHKNSGDYQNYIWISGEDWKADTSLSSIQRARGGIPVNVAGLFNATKSILVIDNVARSIEKNLFEELASGFEKGGIVLATSQFAAPQSPLYAPMPQLSRENAIQILGEDPLAVTDTCDEFVAKFSFSPLILSMTRKIVEMEGVEREKIYLEVLNDPEVIYDDQGISITRKILSRLDSRILEALKKIANSGINYHDANFLRHFIGITYCNVLQRFSILLPANTPGVLRVHDLVSIAVQDNVNAQNIVAAIEKFIASCNGEMTPSVLREIHLCRSQIYGEHVRRGQREIDWLVYALLQCGGDSKQNLHEELHCIDLSPEQSLASVKCIIDAKEIHSYTIIDPEERKAYYNECIQLYEKAIEETQSEDVKAELLHHKGKALRRCGKRIDALSCFMRLLQLRPDWRATYGQIAHLGTQRGADKEIRRSGEEYMRILLNEMLSDASSVPLRVSLAALARLRSYGEITNEVKENPDSVKKLAAIIAMSSLEGLDQFYEAYVSFTSIFGYRYSSYCVNLAEALPEMIAIPPNEVERRQWISACEAHTNTAIAAGRQNKPDLSRRIIEASMKFADEVCKEVKLHPYDARAVAKAYNIGQKPENAIAAINRIDEDKIDHWLLYEKAKAQLELGEQNEALESARKCFQLAREDQKASSRISIYHDLLSRCYETLDNYKSARTELKAAIDNCANDKYKVELQDRLVVLEER